MDTTELLNTLIEGDDLNGRETKAFLSSVMAGEVSPVQCGAILTALRIKGESVDEITGFIEAMRSTMTRVEAPGAIDVVGSGGDSSGTFNISTAASLVVAGAGVKVAKHGNRAASSQCGSADVLEALGVRIELSKEQAEKVFKEAGMVFLFAPLFHPATKQVVAVRKELKVRTIFNILGPFLNPAQTKRQLTGLPTLALAKKMAAVSMKLGYERNLIVVGAGGMDELSTAGVSQGFLVEGKRMRRMTIDPKRYGFKSPTKYALMGGTAADNAKIVRDILGGEQGAKRDIVVLNAGAALFAAGFARDVKDGIERAKKSINSGAAAAALDRLIRISQMV